LIAAQQDFALAHAVADQFRGALGLSKDHLSDAAPGWALVFRAWQRVCRILSGKESARNCDCRMRCNMISARVCGNRTRSQSGRKTKRSPPGAKSFGAAVLGTPAA
jgi:hypothetical protein